MTHRFFKHFISSFLIYALVRLILELATGGTIANLLTVQQLLTALLANAFMASTIPYLVKKD